MFQVYAQQITIDAYLYKLLDLSKMNRASLKFEHDEKWNGGNVRFGKACLVERATLKLHLQYKRAV